jgi:GNAT superfamily N-acetyltransferase
LPESLQVPIHYRPARAEDLERADALIVHSINDLTQQHGFGAMAAPGPAPFQAFSLEDDPGGLWVAEEAGQIVGFAFSWICGDLWFLAQLFVSPDHQGRGVGYELLKQTLEHAEKGAASTRALITFAFNRVSQALYIRHGFFPRMLIYGFSVAREALVDRLPGAQLRHVRLEDSASLLQDLARIDAKILGVSREKHHRYLIRDPAMQGVLFREGDDPVAYAYVGPDGQIGPLAAARPGALGAAFTAALKLAVEGGSARVSAFIPGTCETALSIAVDLGMRISFPMLLMSSRGFGDWVHYLPRNPGFM